MNRENHIRVWYKSPFLLSLLIVASIVLGACTAPLIQAPTPAESTATATPAATPAAAAAAQTEPVVATGTFNEQPVGFTPEGYPFRGAPDAPIVLYEYSDYQCPFCARYFVQTEPALNDSYILRDKVRVVFRDFPIAQLHPNAPAAHIAALCVAEQGSAPMYWQMHDQLFTTQTLWSNLTDPQPHLVDLAEQVGADMTRFNDCVTSGQMEAKIAQGLDEGRALGVTGTPTFNVVNPATGANFILVGAQPYDQFAGIIDALAAGETPPQVQAQAAAPPQPQGQSEAQGSGEIPFWATSDGLQPDPDRPGYTMAGDQYRGNPDAKVAVVEFSDFQCPYCGRHVAETQPILDETFVETDEILWVFKNFPLTIHPQAEAAGVAAECATEQQEFWAMHELLFENVGAWSISDPNPQFVELAGQIGLDTTAFEACLQDGAALQRVHDDASDGQAFVQGTPTFIVLFNGQGRIIPGALPADQFVQALQQVLDGTLQ